MRILYIGIESATSKKNVTARNQAATSTNKNGDYKNPLQSFFGASMGIILMVMSALFTSTR